MKKLSLPPVFVLFVLFFPGYLFAQVPALSSFAPASGPVGTSVTITGTNFSTTPANNIVFFGAVKATVTSASATSLIVTVPAGTTYQPISVAINGLIGYSSKPFITTYAGGFAITQNPDQSQNCFEPKIDSTTDLHPNGTAIADFDGDGKPDIATPNNYSMIGQPASVSILRNTSTVSNISFALHQDIPTGVTTFAIAAGDLNGDGKPDMISSSTFDSRISVFRNTSVIGTISFAPKIEYATGDDPFSISIADLDLDGKPDIIVSNYLSNSISVFKNTSSGGNISFAAKVDFMTNLAPHFAAAGDIDGDGKPDIAVVNEFSNNVSVFRNTSSAGTISFAGKVDFTTGNNPYGVAIGDLDVDGKADLAVANNGSNSYSVFRNTGSAGIISFATKIDYAAGASPYSISIGEINGDAKPEIVVPSFNASVSQNNSAAGTISFASGVYLFMSPAMYIIGIGDLDGDGKNDLAGGAFSSEFISLIRNKNNEPTIRSFTPNNAIAGATVTISGYNFTGVTAVKFGGVPAASFTIVNSTTITAVVGNGATGTVAVTNQYGTNELGTFTFNAPPVVSSFSPTFSGPGVTVTITGSNFTGATAVSFGGTAAASFTINSSTGITAVVGNGATGNVSVTNPYGTGSLAGYTFYPAPTIVSFTPTSGVTGTSITITGTNFTGASVVSIGGVPATSFTINSSTSITAIAADGAAGSISVTAFGGTVTSTNIFSFPPPVITSFAPTSGPAGTTVTINGSNFRTSLTGNVIYFGAAKATVTAATATSLTVTVPPGTTLQPISLSANNYTTFSAFPFTLTFPDNNAGIVSTSFVWKNAFLSNEGPGNVFMSDIDGDGKSDIVTANRSSQTISILRNTSSSTVISFAPFVDIVAGYSLGGGRPVAIGDVNSDGKPDIVVGAFSIKLVVYKNTSTPGNISFAAGIDLPISQGSNGVVIADFDNDSKADIATLASGLTGGLTVSVFRNTGINGNIAFAPVVDFSTVITASDIQAADFNNDGKTDVAFVTSGNSQVSVYRNNSSGPGNISFAAAVGFPVAGSTYQFRTADIDNDGKTDIVNSGTLVFSVLRNTSSGNTISFAPKVDFASGPGQGLYYDMSIGNLDGDGKPDLVLLNDNKSIFVHRNTSTVGTIGFSSYVTFGTLVTYNWVSAVAIGDLDDDSKPELAIANGADNKVSVLRNQVGEQVISVCQNANTSITSNITGSGYQWQVNSGTGFTDLTNNTNYNNVTAVTLQINNIPLTFNNYQYRCVVNGVNSAISNLLVYAPTIPKGTASSPAQTCVNITYQVTFTATNTVPNNSTVQLWESINAGPFALKSSQNYLGGPLNFPQQQTAGSTRKYFFIVTPPASVLCGVANNSDTSTTLIGQVAIPVITANNNVLTVTNPGTGAVYTWQKQNSSNGSWNDISPVVTGTSYTVTSTGAYRVRGISGSCLEYSNAIALTITAVPPVPGNSVGLRAYPNPVYLELIIDTLNLSDKWQTLKIISSDGKLVLKSFDISNQTRVMIDVEQLSPGVYTAILYRKNARPAFIRFIKQMK